MEKLSAFVENARSKGYDDERIRAALLKAGWPADRVAAALTTNTQPPRPDTAQTTPVQQPGAAQTLQPTRQTDDVNLDNLDIDSDKPLRPVPAEKSAPKKPLLKRLLPKVGFGLLVLIGLAIVVNGFNAYNRTRVPGNFATTKGQIAFSIPGKKGQYDTRVNFKTPDGANHSFVTPTPPGDNNNSKYVAGDGMKVGYYPQNPDMTAMNLTDRGSPLIGIVIMAVGALITIVSAFFLQRHLRRR